MNPWILLTLLFATTAISPAITQTDVYTKEYRSDKYFLNNNQNVLLNVPFVHQVEGLPNDKKTEIRASACGPASIDMVLKYMGTDIDLYTVIEKLPTSVYVRGQMFYNLYDGSKYFDKETVRIKNSPELIFQTLKNGNPLIMNIQNYNGYVGHAIVVVGIKNFDGKHADALIVHDPFKEGFREFKYVDDKTLKQPEGFNNYIGSLDPFYITEKSK